MDPRVTLYLYTYSIATHRINSWPSNDDVFFGIFHNKVYMLFGYMYSHAPLSAHLTRWNVSYWTNFTFYRVVMYI